MKQLLHLALSALLLSACSDSDAPSSEDPASFMEVVPLGHQAAPAVTIGKDGTLAWFKALVSGSRLPDGQAPARIGFLDAAVKCGFPKPEAGERLVQIQTNGSAQPSGIVAISATQLASLTGTPEALASHLADPASARQSSALKVVDVVVTDATGPIYLVLAGGNDILWNIQKAPGAVISHVALIAGENVGIANLDPAVPVSVLAGKTAVECGVEAARRPAQNWAIVASAAEGEILAIDEVKQHTEKFDRYDAWFKSIFGVESEPVTIGIEHMSHALVGAAPASLEQRLPYRGLDAASVLVAKTGTVFYAHTPEDYAARMQGMLTGKAAVN